MKSILPKAKEAKSFGVKHKYSFVGPGTKVILLTSHVPTAQQNSYLPREQLLSLNTSSFTSTEPSVATRPGQRVALTKEKLSIETKDEQSEIEPLYESKSCAKGIPGRATAILPPEDLRMIKDFITSYMVNPDILLTPQLAFYKKFIENLGAKVPTSSGKKGSSQITGPKKPDKPKVLQEVDPSKDYKCSLCDRVYLSSYHLESHMESHNDEKEKPYMCSICGKCFRSKFSLRNHMVTHTGERPYKCKQCDRAFKSNILLINHTRMIHTGERPYKCKYCLKAFSVKFKLKKHLLTHTGVKSYICIKCHKAFATKGNLKVHMLIHTGEKRYICKECGKAFAHNSVLTKHMRTHTGERPFKCTECGVTFAWKGHLIGHMRIHTGERPYQCRVCGNTFSQSYALKKHAKTHTGERPYQCSHCDKNFKYRSSLNAHMKKTDGINKEFKNNPIQMETQCDDHFKYSSSINENMKVNSDNAEVVNNGTVMISHLHNAETAHNTAIPPMTDIQEYSCYPWYNGREGCDTFQKTDNPGNKNYCLFRIEQSQMNNGVQLTSL